MNIPRKHFGQHFLCDQGVIARILRALNPKKGDQLVEIGPGQGALTLPLLRQQLALDVIEIDRDLVDELKRRTHGLNGLTIHGGDVLAFDFSSLKTSEPLRVFGNLPYNISTPLIFHLLKYIPIVHDMLFMLQKEVADRLAAKVGTKAYGRLSVMVQADCEVETLFDVSPQSFYPPPKVTSSIVRLTPYALPPFEINDRELFAAVVRDAFGQRRKTLRNSLKNKITDEIWEKLPFKSDLRAENLSVKDFAMIALALEKR